MEEGLLLLLYIKKIISSRDTAPNNATIFNFIQYCMDNVRLHLCLDDNEILTVTPSLGFILVCTTMSKQVISVLKTRTVNTWRF